MDGAHLHLIVNHLPVYAVAIGFFVWIAAIIRGSRDLRLAALALFIVAGIAGWIALQSGEAAEHAVEALPGVTEAIIHEHENAAEFANISSTIVALLAVAAEWIARRRERFARRALIVVAVFAFWSLTTMLRTAYLGGLVRPTEIRGE